MMTLTISNFWLRHWQETIPIADALPLPMVKKQLTI